VAPRYLGSVEPAPDRLWLWLEDLDAGYVGGRSWSVARCLLAARHIGAFNGAYLTGRALPTASWLNNNCLEAVSDPKPELVGQVRDPAIWRDAGVARLLPPGTGDRVIRLLEARERLLDTVRRLPRTLCHQDAHRQNLFSRKALDANPPKGLAADDGAEDQTVAIDWAQAGLGAVGEDLVQLTYDLTVFSHLAPHPQPLHQAAFAAYLQGLHDVGWGRGEGGARLARLGYSAAAAIRSGLATLSIVPSELVAGPEEAARGTAGRHARALLAYLDLADDALALSESAP
jgi:hypothetical protein